MPAEAHPVPDRSRLRADCSRCAALCCVAPAFAASNDFALTKPAGTPCPNLQTDFRCGIHSELRDRGFPGCTVYDCFGAGQQVVQGTYAGRTWRDDDVPADQMFDVFTVVRRLHELLWYLTEALAHPAAGPLVPPLRDALLRTEELTQGTPEEILALDLVPHGRAVDRLLVDFSRGVRSAVPRRPDHRGADLVGRRMRGADLRGADLRGAWLIGADLRGADLRLADLIGADLRGADLRGADLSSALFLTQPQVNAAKGDEGTRLPAGVTAPGHWSPVSLGMPRAQPRRPRARRPRG